MRAPRRTRRSSTRYCSQHIDDILKPIKHAAGDEDLPRRGAGVRAVEHAQA